jgi:hypothetical protein
VPAPTPTMSERQRMLTSGNSQTGSQRDRPGQFMIAFGHDNLPRRGQELRRSGMRRRVLYLIGAAAACLLAFELVAIVLLRR